MREINDGHVGGSGDAHQPSPCDLRTSAAPALDLDLDRRNLSRRSAAVVERRGLRGAGSR
jgi:hypothetical protein